MPRLLLAGRAILLMACAAAFNACATLGASDEGRRLVLVTIDGARWQEVFRGVDPSLLAAGGGSGGSAAFARPAGTEGRRALMPFLWETVARQGQIFGNVDRGSRVVCANASRKSYPGYHEMLAGFVSPTILGNDKIANPDATVLEWLNRRRGFVGAIAAFVSWDVFPFILNRERSGLLIAQGEGAGLPGVVDRLRDETPPPWQGSVYDAFVFHAALRHLAERRPRVLYIALGDVDEWAHAGRYDRYLEALERSDRWLRELWQTLEALPTYRGRTSLVVTTDHGRGADLGSWRKHGPDVAGSEQAWVAVLGPGTPAAGERSGHPPLTLAQVAATLAALVDEDYLSAVPGAAAPLPLGAAAAR